MIVSMAEAVRRDIPADYVQAVIRQKLAGSTSAELDAVLTEATRTNAAKMGVFCLAERINSVLMWSHYASNHRGIALEFDFKREPDCALLPLWKVTYQTDRPVLSDVYSERPALPLADALATKAKFWSYEQEWRSMKPDGAHQIVSFNPDVITGLVLGANCTSADEGWLRDRIAGTPIRLHRMVPDRTTFGLGMRTLD